MGVESRQQGRQTSWVGEPSLLLTCSVRGSPSGTHTWGLGERARPAPHPPTSGLARKSPVVAPQV